jgi:hypothetical protein
MHAQARTLTPRRAAAASDSEVAGLKETIQKLETKVQRFVEFRERLIRALGIRAVSVPDSEILDRVESLARLRPSSAVDIMNMSSSLHPLTCVPRACHPRAHPSQALHLPHHVLVAVADCLWCCCRARQFHGEPR